MNIPFNDDNPNVKSFGIYIFFIIIVFQGCGSSGEIAQAQQNKPAAERVSTEVSPSPAESPNETGKNTSAIPNPDEVIVDSKLSFAEAIGDQNVPESIRKDLDLVDLEYFSLDGKVHRGQLVIHRSLRQDVVDIFREIKENKFPIAKMIPVSRFGFSDDKSMEANNTSCFNYREKTGSRQLSNHAYGKALDINPLFNPYIKNGKASPSNAKYEQTVPGTINGNSPITLLFKKRGWKWGGDWKDPTDYQHFEKVP